MLSEITELSTRYMGRNYLDMKQVIKYTSLSGSTVRRAINKGELKPCKRIGKLLFQVNEIDRWLNG